MICQNINSEKYVANNGVANAIFIVTALRNCTAVVCMMIMYDDVTAATRHRLAI